MYYQLNPKDTDSYNAMFSINGDPAGVVKEADTSDGYIVRYECDAVFEESNNLYKSKIEILPNEVDTYRTVKRYGRVDYIGDSRKDSPKLLYERLNKVRLELGLEPHPPSPLEE